MLSIIRSFAPHGTNKSRVDPAYNNNITLNRTPSSPHPHSSHTRATGINTKIVAGLCKLIGSTLTKYKDPASQALVRNLIVSLAQHHSDLTFEHLNAVCRALIAKDLAQPSLKASQAAVIALGWSTLLATHGDRESAAGSAEFNKLIDSQAVFYQLALGAPNARVTARAVELLHRFWSDVETAVERSFEVLLRAEPASHVILFLSAILSFRHDRYDGDEQWLFAHKAALLEHFIKGIVVQKVKPREPYIPACALLLRSIDAGEFKGSVLAALQRAMLRSPEIVLQAVGAIVHELRIDVSDFAEELGRPLIQNLYSKDDAARQDAARSLGELARRSSRTEVLEKLLRQIFAVLNGADGKITVTEYRVNVLQGAGNLSENAIAAPQREEFVRTTVTELFVKALETEIHERVLCHTLEMFGLWSRYFTGELPKRITDAFKSGLALKSTTHSVRVAYLQWLLACLNESQMTAGVDLSAALIKTVEKAGQTGAAVPQIAEAVAATCLLLKTEETGPAGDAKLQTFWPIVVDMRRQVFVGEKFLASVPADTLCYVMLMAKLLLTEHADRFKGSVAPLYRAIVYATNAPSAKVRAYCLPLAGELVRSKPHGAQHASRLLEELTEYVQVAKIAEASSAGADETTIPAQAFVQSIRAVSAVSASGGAGPDAQCIALGSLLCCHQPAIKAAEPNLWELVLRDIALDPKSFISLNTERIRGQFIDAYRAIPIYENAIGTITKVSPEIVLPIIVQRVRDQLNNSEMASVTDDEYFTFLQPDGELFDKSVLPSDDELYKDLSSRRENKIYSYKDQLEEIQLRRELEEKRRKEGKWKPPQLTQKQKEAVEKQLEKERTIRKRLTALNERLSVLVSLIQGVLNGNPAQLSLYFAQLLPSILRVLQSPLAASALTALYYDLRRACFAGGDAELVDLGERIARITLRLHEPHCDLDAEWTENNATEAVILLLQDLALRTMPPQVATIGANGTDDGHSPTGLFNAPAFAYAFEFLRKALSSKAVAVNDDVLLVTIALIGRHAQNQGATITGELTDYTHPKYAPRLEMLKLLLYIVGTERGRVQTEAVAALLNVAHSSSAAKYQATADLQEIEALLVALQHPHEAVRDVALRALTIMVAVLAPLAAERVEFGVRMTRRLWVAKHDPAEDNRVLAEILWDTLRLPLADDAHVELLRDVVHAESIVQKAAAAALVSLLDNDADGVKLPQVLPKLLAIYLEKLTMIPATTDQFGREVDPAIDQWGPRCGVAIALCQVARFFGPADVDKVMQFMVSKGLGDREELVHKEMLAAALAIVDLHGKETITRLLPLFEHFLDKAPKSSYYDNIRQAVVILMGSLARHLNKEDERIQPIVKRLIAALSTPSQQVQEAVANCLPHLMPSIKDEAPNIIKKLLQQLVKSEKYGERRGAAYGIAGVVKGLGILSLKQLEIMNKLTQHIQEKKNYKSREGALFAFEMLCTTLGRLFEPYIVHVLPHLLQCFGDSSQYVRQAADDTARVVMGKLSAHGVKLVLPSLLNALDEDSWRTKTASVELLGAMAYCAPKQLSSCLPSIVPKLIEVLGDSHTKVQEAGGDALKVIGSVIKNPEIQAIVPTLLRALEDPSANTSKCLQSLLATKFVHFIDAPSLALIMPVVQRAFMDRSTETRKMAAQIIGNMYSLTDQKDLLPYLPNIIPGLKTSLLDPVPEVRAVSSRALGAMVKGMGESSFDDLLPWLMQTLTSETSSVDRSGAAQGLSEVVGGLGVEKLHKLMPEIIATAERTDIAPHVKDGYIMMFIYMPSAFPNEFTPYIGLIINPILKALADENEYVRDTALKAGQRIVNLYAESAVQLLLPELEKGLFDDNWRIRFSSVQLLGDLLYRISGVSGKMTTETASEDDNFGTEQSHTAIIRFLGAERRNRVLAGLYMGRSDVSLMVRQAALHVWKVVVTNTPRTLREILPTLFGLLLGCLASTSYDKRQVAARTLGDLVRKLGERVLPEIIPILERGLDSDQADQRQGVCIGLSEIMASTSKDMVLTFVNSLVPTVRKALSDPLPEVRQAAAKTFDSLHSTVGSRALDDILPSMLAGLSDPDPDVAESTLDGLRQVMAIKSRVVLPYLVPQLTSTPVNTKALSILASVAGEALTKYLPKILPALLHALAAAQATSAEQQEMEYCQAVVLSVSDEVGVRTVMDTLMDSTKSDCVEVRRAAAALLCAFCTHSPGDYSQYVPQLLRGLLRLLADKDKDVVQRSWDALNAVTKTMDSAQQIAHVSDVRQAVRFAASELQPGEEMPGFCLPKGLSPLLPVFREAVLNGLPEDKENAAQGMGELIWLTCPASLSTAVIGIAGPLIRILGDRFNANVKASVLETLTALLSKVGMMLKQFLPQLQTTFLKSLHDSNRLVRMRAGQALAHLVVIHTRADPLFTEMHNGVKGKRRAESCGSSSSMNRSLNHISIFHRQRRFGRTRNHAGRFARQHLIGWR